VFLHRELTTLIPIYYAVVIYLGIFFLFGNNLSLANYSTNISNENTNLSNKTNYSEKKKFLLNKDYLVINHLERELDIRGLHCDAKTPIFIVNFCSDQYEVLAKAENYKMMEGYDNPNFDKNYL